MQVIADEDPQSQSQGQSSYPQMWELDHNEGWAPNNWCFQTVVLEKTLESPLNCKEIKFVKNLPSILNEINSEYSLKGLMLKLQHFGADAKSQLTELIWKDSDAGKDWRQQEKGEAEDWDG